MEGGRSQPVSRAASGLVLGAALVGGLLVAGCGDDGPFSSDELGTLRTFSISLAVLPPDPSNQLADDPAAAELGKRFFFEPAFAGPLGAVNAETGIGSLGAPGDAGKISCASCHDLTQGGSDHRSIPSATSLGADYTGRNAPSVINAAFAPRWQFWDGRRDSLWSQALSPTENPIETNGSRLRVAHVIQNQYSDAYAAVFGAPPPDVSDASKFPDDGKPGDAAFDGLPAADQEAIDRVFANFGKALEAYERRLTSQAFQPSDFDRFVAPELFPSADGRAPSLAPAAIRGARLFIGKAGCRECHRGPLLTDFGFHNIGVPQEGDHVPIPDYGRYSGLYGPTSVKADTFNRAGRFSDAPIDPADPEAAVLAAADVASPAATPDTGRFKTPSLRNVAATAPYMHDGVYQNLWDVVNHYNFAGATEAYAGERDPEIEPLLLTDAELGDLVEFLSTLSDGPPLDPALVGGS